MIPEFYARDEQGIPTAWIHWMRESMAQLTPRFSATRAVREYTEQHYLPAAEEFRRRAAGEGREGGRMVDWRLAVEKEWPAVRFGERAVETHGDQHVFDVQIYLGGLDGESPVRQEMQRVRQLAGAYGGYAYHAEASATRPASDYTPRVVPHFDGVAVPLENTRILWQN